MADREEDLAEKALNKLEEFHKKQREIEWDRRKKRNAEVDQLISQLGDPKVAEKLRIYRLVEEQFNHIETEIEKQVQAELKAKKRQQKEIEPKKIHQTKNPGNVLSRARKLRMELAKELQNEDPPEPIKDNLAKIWNFCPCKIRAQISNNQKVSVVGSQPRLKYSKILSYRPF